MNKWLICILFSFASFYSYGQNDYNGQGWIRRVFIGEGDYYTGQKSSRSTDAQARSSIKLNLFSIPYSTINLQYELGLSEKMSFAFGARYTWDIPFIYSGMESYLNSSFESSSDGFKITLPKLTGYAVTPELRWYPKKAMKGFYVSPYFRYRNFRITSPMDFSTSTGVIPGDLDINVNTMIGGLAIGHHWSIANKVSIEVQYFGIQYGSSIGDISWKGKAPLSVQDQADFVDDVETFRQDFKDLFSMDLPLEPTTSSDGVNIETRFALPGIRLLNLWIGYRF